MGAFGERLRREREMRDISLDEIAAVTKIGTRLLRALEDEQFDLLPGGIFNKGYVRAYAKYVGIDEEQAVADYLQAAHEAPPAVHGTAGETPPSRFEGASREQLSAPRRSTFPVVPVLIVLVLIAGIAGGWRLYLERQFDRRARVATAGTRDTTLHDSTVSPPATSMSTPGKSPSPQTDSGMTDHGGTDVIGSAKPADARASAPGASPVASDGRTGQTAATQLVSGQNATDRKSTV